MSSSHNPGNDLSAVDWPGLARTVVDILRRTNDNDIEIVRADNSEQFLFVLFRNPALEYSIVQGLLYDVSTGNYEGDYRGDPDVFAGELINFAMLEPGYMHKAEAGQIHWRVTSGIVAPRVEDSRRV